MWVSNAVAELALKEPAEKQKLLEQVSTKIEGLPDSLLRFKVFACMRAQWRVVVLQSIEDFSNPSLRCKVCACMLAVSRLGFTSQDQRTALRPSVTHRVGMPARRPFVTHRVCMQVRVVMRLSAEQDQNLIVTNSLLMRIESVLDACLWFKFVQPEAVLLIYFWA